MDAAAGDAYLARIGAVRPRAADATALRELHALHLASVPFENLGIHLGEPVVLDEQELVAKLVSRRRGGFCYELNGALAGLLSALGFSVTLLAARMYSSSGGGLGPPFDHLALRVDTVGPDAGAWLVDVGAGATFRHPLRFDARGEQADPYGVMVLRELPDGDVELVKDGTPVYRVEPRPRALADFEPTCWWHQTSPRSHFTRSLVCSLPTRDGRITLSGRTLVRTVGTERREEVLPDEAAVLAAYRDHFGITLDRAPAVPQEPVRPAEEAPTGAAAGA